MRAELSNACGLCSLTIGQMFSAKAKLFFIFCCCHWLSWLLSVMPESRGTRARHRDSFSWMPRETTRHLATAHKMDFTHDHRLSNRRHRRKSQLCKSLITNAWSWTLHAFFLCCIALRISPKSASAVDFSAVTNIHPHAAHALLHPTRCFSKRTSLKTSRVQELQNFLKFVLSTRNNKIIWRCE